MPKVPSTPPSAMSATGSASGGEAVKTAGAGQTEAIPPAAPYAAAPPSADGLPSPAVPPLPPLPTWGGSLGTPADYPSIGSSIAWSFVSLGVVCLVAYFGLRWLSRRNPRAAGGHGPLRVVARQNLDPKHSVFVVEAGERCFLIGSGDQSLSLIAELDRDVVQRQLPKPQPLAWEPATKRFAEILGRAMSRLSAPGSQSPKGPVREQGQDDEPGFSSPVKAASPVATGALVTTLPLSSSASSRTEPLSVRPLVDGEGA